MRYLSGMVSSTVFICRKCNNVRFQTSRPGGSGSTVEEAKKDCFTFYDEMKAEYPEENLPELDVAWVTRNKGAHTGAPLQDFSTIRLKKHIAKTVLKSKTDV